MTSCPLCGEPLTCPDCGPDPADPAATPTPAPAAGPADLTRIALTTTEPLTDPGAITFIPGQLSIDDAPDH